MLTTQAIRRISRGTTALRSGEADVVRPWACFSVENGTLPGDGLFMHADVQLLPANAIA
jgi:hypothetical protein